MNATTLLFAIEHASPERGIWFSEKNDAWEFWSYERLARDAHAFAAGLVSMGVEPGEIVSIVQRTSPEFVVAFAGAWLAGCTPSPIAPPIAFQDSETYADHVSNIVACAKPRLLIVEPEFNGIREQMRGDQQREKVEMRTVADLVESASAERPARPLPHYAVVQFTSGSSGHAKGVCLTFAAVEANVSAIHEWLEWTPQDAFASWLPLYHDMGLVGALITSLARGTTLWLMRPEHFLRRPDKYLRLFGDGRASLTATPPLTLDVIVRKVPDRALSGLDFSGWKRMVVGAERIEPSTLERFERKLFPYGLSPLVIAPAYGMAEATLAITGMPACERWSSFAVARQALSLGHNALAARHAPGERVVACGRALGDSAVTVVDGDDRELPEGCIGELVVVGSSVMERYLALHDGASISTGLSAQRLRTGDAGFVVDGQFYVLGRIGDSLKIRGRVLFAEDLELGLCELGVLRRDLAVLLGVHHGLPTAVALLEGSFAQGEAARQMLVQRTEGAHVVVVHAKRGAILRTSSGKPRRRALWKRFADGSLVNTASV